ERAQGRTSWGGNDRMNHRRMVGGAFFDDQFNQKRSTNGLPPAQVRLITMASVGPSTSTLRSEVLISEYFLGASHRNSFSLRFLAAVTRTLCFPTIAPSPAS